MIVTRIIIKYRGNNPYFFSVQSVAGAIILFLIPTTIVFPHQQSMMPSKRHFSPVIAWCRSQAHFRHNFKLSSSPYNWKLLLLVAPHDTINHLMLERSLNNFVVNGHFARAEDSSNFHGPEPALDELLEAFELAAALEDGLPATDFLGTWTFLPSSAKDWMKGSKDVILLLDVINEAGHFHFSIFKHLLGLICSKEIHNVSMLLQDSLLKNLKQLQLGQLR